MYSGIFQPIITYDGWKKSEHAVTAEELKMACFFADLPKMPVLTISGLRVGHLDKTRKKRSMLLYFGRFRADDCGKTEHAVTPTRKKQ